MIICEGFGDVGFINALLRYNAISNCNVGCPTKKTATAEGKDGIPSFLGAIVQLQTLPALEGVAIIVDGDNRAKKTFDDLSSSWTFAELIGPTKPFRIEQTSIRVATFVMPGKGKRGALEHLLLQAVFGKKPRTKRCVEQFASCMGKVKSWKTKQQAKMKMAAAISASCERNPYCSPGWVWSYKGNPIPISSPHFTELSDFLRAFSDL